MNKSIYEIAKQNLVHFIGAPSYAEVVRANEEDIKKYCIVARKQMRLRSRIKPKINASGNPYVMLCRKIDNKGKRV